MRTIKIGSRKSRLAVVQAEAVAGRIRAYHPDVYVQLVTMDTAGDRDQQKSLDSVEGKGFFTEDLEAALREGTIDLCVHSLKDMALELPDDLPILAFSTREDPRDVLVLPDRGSAGLADSLPDIHRLRAGSSSARRSCQLLRLFPDIAIAPIRGNVPTRIEKLDRGEYGVLVLAAAGLKRLNLGSRISYFFSIAEMIPAAGQGILAIQGRRDFDSSLLAELDDPKSRTAALAERLVIKNLNGGCSLPSAAFCEVSGGEVRIRALYCAPENGKYAVRCMAGNRSHSLDIALRLSSELRSEVDGI